MSSRTLAARSYTFLGHSSSFGSRQAARQYPSRKTSRLPPRFSRASSSTIMSATRAPYVINPTAEHTATVIFVHGLGDNGAGWLPVANMMKVELPNVKWLLPNAPNRGVTINNGAVMPAWFDLLTTDFDSKKEDRDGLLDSARTIDKYIQAEIDAGIPAERIVVGGFSQGGSLSLLVGLTARGGDGLFGGKEGWKLGGVAVLSGWMSLSDEFPKMVSPHLPTTPVLMCHGKEDPLVPLYVAQKTGKILTDDLGLPVLESLMLSKSIPSGYSSDEGKLGVAGLSFRSYSSVAHEASPRTVEDLKVFLKRVFSY